MTGDISFASFNLLNFQEAGKKAHRKLVSADLYERKLEWTRHMLRDVDADVIAFQELWSKACLEDVFSLADFEDYELTYIKEPDDNPWYGIAVALAVRKPWRVKGKRLYKNFPFENIYKLDEDDGEDDEVEVKIKRFSRTIINAVLENADSDTIPEIDVFAAHLKAKLPSSANAIEAKHRSAVGSAISTIRRTAEAAALRWILTEHMKGSTIPTVVIGDLNDDPRSNTLALITEQPTLKPTSRGRDTALYSALQLEQLRSFRDVFYTHEYNNMKDTLDHILVSEEFFEPSDDAIWRHTETKIWNDFIEDQRDHTSDHGIIKASFRYR